MLLTLSIKLSDGKCVMGVRGLLRAKLEPKLEAGEESPGDKKEQDELAPVQFDRPSGEVVV
jgi:hypothetical protein